MCCGNPCDCGGVGEVWVMGLARTGGSSENILDSSATNKIRLDVFGLQLLR